jgi:hypothetical protein
LPEISLFFNEKDFFVKKIFLVIMLILLSLPVLFAENEFSFDGGDNTKPLAGTGLQGRFHLLPSVSLFAETGYTWHGFSDTEAIHGLNIGIGVSLNLGEILRPQTRVTGERLNQERVFPVSFAWYEKNSIAVVRITNNEKNAVADVRLSFMLERYMNQSYQFASMAWLGPGESAEFPVTALFNETMLDLTENISANTRITVEYKNLGAEKSVTFPAAMTIYHRNAFAWDDDKRAASFVSAKDPAASYFANFTAQGVERYLRENPNRFATVPKNVLFAAALFETLNLYGINYVVDPSSSFIELSENAQLYPMRESWAVYRSMSVSGAGDRLPEMPDEEKVIGAFEREMGIVQ